MVCLNGKLSLIWLENSRFLAFVAVSVFVTLSPAQTATNHCISCLILIVVAITIYQFSQAAAK